MTKGGDKIPALTGDKIKQVAFLPALPHLLLCPGPTAMTASSMLRAPATENNWAMPTFCCKLLINNFSFGFQLQLCPCAAYWVGGAAASTGNS